MKSRDYLRVIPLLLILIAFVARPGQAQAQSGPIVRLVYFYSQDCPHCILMINEVLTPLQTERGAQVQIKTVEISEPVNYEMMIRAEEMLNTSSEARWPVPTLIIGGQALTGEDEIRDRLPCLIDTCLEKGGTMWPDIPGLAAIPIEGDAGLGPSWSELGVEGVEPCGPEDEDAAACEGAAPIWMAYFYEVGCQECSRAEYDIRYVQSKYPQLLVEEYNVQDNAALSEWLGARTGLPADQRLATPALFVGEDYLVGTDLTAEAVSGLTEKYVATGAEQVWAEFDAGQAQQSIIERFKSFGPLTVAFAGLVDGLNPCAFATLAFFVSYLALICWRKKRLVSMRLAARGQLCKMEGSSISGCRTIHC